MDPRLVDIDEHPMDEGQVGTTDIIDHWQECGGDDPICHVYLADGKPVCYVMSAAYFEHLTGEGEPEAQQGRPRE